MIIDRATGRGGVLLASSAYVLWGLSALYWPLLRPAGTIEILSMRVLCSLGVLVVLITAVGRWPELRAVVSAPGRVRRLLLLAVAAVLTAVNWGVFIYATTHGLVVDASMGYFITPLVMVLLGVIVFRERPRRWQWVAVGIGTAGVAVLVVGYGEVPWVALTLAATFGVYGLIKKSVGIGAVEGMTIETAVLTPLALGYVLVLQADGDATFGHVSTAHTALMVGASAAMLAPMLMFSAAANRIPLALVGLLQYIEPVIQFLIGLAVFAEAVGEQRWVAFGLVWIALGVLAVESTFLPGGTGRRLGRGLVRGWRRAATSLAPDRLLVEVALE
ncbi:MAG TPA: EamA family transporter RarD [Jiangellaceae bacterium]